MSNSDWQKTKEIFDEALEQPVERRSQFLLETCGSDDKTREEVESLLKNYQLTFLEKSPKDKILELITDRLAIEQKIAGRYLILKKLGKGGMGEVYLAEDPKLNRLTALKVLNEELSQDKNRLKQFEDEAKKAASIDNDHIIKIYDFDEAEGISFITMEFFESETLRRKLKKSSFDTKTTLEIALQIASALESAHKREIYHCDIKPENILINDKGKVKITDFGIAKLIEREPSEIEFNTLQQRQRQMVGFGTPNYMSPEQISGEEIDGRSDIWNLSVCLYEMLTKKKPFWRKTSKKIEAAILEADPDPIEKDIPPLLKSIIEKALQKEPNDRYQTINDLRLDLQTVLKTLGLQSEGNPANSRADSDSFKEWRKNSGRRISNILFGCIFICFMSSLGYSMYFSNLLDKNYSVTEINNFKQKIVEGETPIFSKRERKRVADELKNGKNSPNEQKINDNQEVSSKQINQVLFERLTSDEVKTLAFYERIKRAAKGFQVVGSFFHFIILGIALFYYWKKLKIKGFGDIEKDKEDNGNLKSNVTDSTSYTEVSDWKTARDTAVTAFKDYRDTFVGLLTAWLGLYFLVFLSDFNFFQTSHLISSLLAQANNFNTICLWLCFRILNEPISTESKTQNSQEIVIKSSFQAQPLRWYLSIFGVMFLWFVLELGLTLDFNDQAEIIHQISRLISGIFGGIAMAVFVGRFQSKFLKSPEKLVIVFYLYTVIQSLFIFFGDNKIESALWAAGVIQTALLLKCLLILYMFWLFHSGRLLFYLVRARRADKDIDKEWENFTEVLKQENSGR